MTLDKERLQNKEGEKKAGKIKRGSGGATVVIESLEQERVKG